MRSVNYNSQRDNFNFAGKFFGWAQCFSTSAWMFMSYYSKKILAGDDSALAKYVDDVEASVGDVGIAEQVISRLKLKISGHSSLYWAIQEAAITKWLNAAGVKGSSQYYDARFPIENLPGILESGPVIIGTNKIGGLPGGHIILLVDYDKKTKTFVVNDPYGDAKTNYKDQKGKSVLYPEEWLAPFITVKAGLVRCIFWK